MPILLWGSFAHHDRVFSAPEGLGILGHVYFAVRGTTGRGSDEPAMGCLTRQDSALAAVVEYLSLEGCDCFVTASGRAVAYIAAEYRARRRYKYLIIESLAARSERIAPCGAQHALLVNTLL